MTPHSWSRRSVLAALAAAPAAIGGSRALMAAPRKKIPVGLGLYTLKDEEEKDRLATLRTVAKMGYEGVEFWGPYVDWKPAYAKEVRKQLDDLGIACYSAHTRPSHWSDDKFPGVMELNKILGSRYVVMDHAPESPTLDGWKKNAELLTKGHEKLKPLGIKAALHNWTTEWRLHEGVRPIDFLAKNTPPGFGFQLDLGTAFGEKGRSDCLHQGEPRPCSVLPPQGLVGGPHPPWAAHRRGRRGLDGAVQGGRGQGRGRVLPDRAGGQSLHPARDGGAVAQELPPAPGPRPAHLTPDDRRWPCWSAGFRDGRPPASIRWPPHARRLSGLQA